MPYQEKDLVNMTCTELDNLKVQLQMEFQKARDNLQAVELAELELSKEILNKQESRKELQIAASKARHIVRTMALDIKIVEAFFWKNKDGR